MYYNSNPAKRHDTPALLVAVVDPKLAANASTQLYKALAWNVDGIADVCDSYGVSKKVITKAGGVYPLENYGVVTGGNTNLIQGDFIALYD